MTHNPSHPSCFLFFRLLVVCGADNRSCVRPEIGRTRTFGEKGVSKGQFYKRYLKFIRLNDEVVNFTKINVSYLLKQNYDQASCCFFIILS
jgi:hypothetical protein